MNSRFVHLNAGLDSIIQFNPGNPIADETSRNISEQTEFAVEDSRSAAEINEPTGLYAWPTIGRSNDAERNGIDEFDHDNDIDSANLNIDVNHNSIKCINR